MPIHARTLLRRLDKPYYAFRPQQTVRRLGWSVRATRGRHVVVRLPWGVPLEVSNEDAIGAGIGRTGVHDLTVTEALWRLVRPGGLVVDAGANIGYLTGLLAVRAGPGGRVVAYEPHPAIRSELERNVDRLGSRAASVDIRGVALSDRRGYAELITGSGFERNQGTAALVDTASPPNAPGMRVATVTLDGEFPWERLDCLKIDVEGHEHAVLQGAERLLAGGRIRHIVYEDHGPYPTGASTLLERHGYDVLGLGRGFTGPRLGSPWHATVALEAPSYLATIDEGVGLSV
jgi:FkbM family methyltransferase